MPLADDCGLIPCLLKHFRECRLGAVKPLLVLRVAVDMTVLSRQQRGAARPAQRIGDEAILESHSLGGDAVEVGRLVDSAAMAAHGVAGVIIRHDVNDVGAACIAGLHQGCQRSGRGPQGR